MRSGGVCAVYASTDARLVADCESQTQGWTWAYLTDTTEHAVMPAATTDPDGTTHVIWYDTAGAHGVLRYAASRSTTLTDGLEDSLVVDDDATDGNSWSPSSEDRRLREYIDIAVDRGSVYVAWTHAPAPPPRVHFARIDR
jgi:hypothetical protein